LYSLLHIFEHRNYEINQKNVKKRKER
jgi:hypothetical protein